MKQKLKVWDLSTRLFHWLLVLSVIFMWYSGKVGGNLMAWHLRCGLFILALIVFRVCIGIWGSDTSRFCQFIRGPRQIIRYLKGELTENEQPGHNPLGALMVVALLVLLLIQLVSGLFASDENMWLYNGYLNGLVQSSTGELAHNIHVLFFNVLLVFALVHVVTVLFYKFVKKHNLIKPMITGYKELEGQLPKLRFMGLGGFICAVIVAVVVIVAVLNVG